MNQKHLNNFITAVVSWGYTYKDSVYYVKDYLDDDEIGVTDDDLKHMQDFYFKYSKEIYNMIDDYGEGYEYMDDLHEELTEKYFDKYINNLVESEESVSL